MYDTLDKYKIVEIILLILLVFLVLIIISYLYNRTCTKHMLTRSPSPAYIDKVFYINLDKRADRKSEIEAELTAFGLPFERFSAISHEFGAVGCSKSHVAVLKLAKERKYKRILILEDDFTFKVSKEDFDLEMSKIHDSGKIYDVCMISYNVMKSEPAPEPFWTRVLDSQTTSGYLVNEHYYDTLINLVEPSIPLLEKTHEKYNYAIDVVIKKVQPRDRWYHTNTRIGVQRPGYSDIEEQDVNYNV